MTTEHTHFGITEEFIGSLVDKHGTLDNAVLFDGKFEIWVNDNRGPATPFTQWSMHLGEMENPTLQHFVDILEKHYDAIVESFGNEEFDHATFLGPYPITGIEQGEFGSKVLNVQRQLVDPEPNGKMELSVDELLEIVNANIDKFVVFSPPSLDEVMSACRNGNAVQLNVGA